MTTDDLRTRARAAALKWEPACQGEPSTPSDYVSIGRRVGFEFGYLAHAAQQPSRGIDVGELARVIERADMQWTYTLGLGGTRHGYIARAVHTYLLTGDESDE